MSIQVVTITPTVSTSPAYTSGDAVGGKNTITLNVASGFKGVLREIEIVDQAKQSAAIDLMFFKADPAATTFTDNAALDVADADLLNHCGTISVAAANYAALYDNSVATLSNQSLRLEANSTSIYMVLITRGTPTYAATTDIQVTLTIEVL